MGATLHEIGVDHQVCLVEPAKRNRADTHDLRHTLGTALGDFTADDTGLNLGFEKGALLFAGLIVVVALLHRLKALPQAVLFWAAYVLTRPLGATLGDTLTKPHQQGGFEFGRFTATAVIAVAVVVLISLAPKLRRPREAGGA